MNICWAAITIVAGEICDSCKEVCAAGELHQARHPYTRGLLHCLPQIDTPPGKLPILQRDPAWQDGPL